MGLDYVYIDGEIRTVPREILEDKGDIRQWLGADERTYENLDEFYADVLQANHRSARVCKPVPHVAAMEGPPASAISCERFALGVEAMIKHRHEPPADQLRAALAAMDLQVSE